MNYNQSEVSLSINIVGEQAMRGIYSHYHRIEKNGKEINGVRTEKQPVFCKSFKQVKLGNEFVKGALEEPPSYMKMRPVIWRKIPAQKRIAIHVGSYVKETHPEHKGYTMEIL